MERKVSDCMPMQQDQKLPATDGCKLLTIAALALAMRFAFFFIFFLLFLVLLAVVGRRCCICLQCALQGILSLSCSSCRAAPFHCDRISSSFCSSSIQLPASPAVGPWLPACCWHAWKLPGQLPGLPVRVPFPFFVQPAPNQDTLQGYMLLVQLILQDEGGGYLLSMPCSIL